MFSQEMLQRCQASADEIRQAKLHGEKVVYTEDAGTVTSYLWNGEIYVTDIELSK